MVDAILQMHFPQGTLPAKGFRCPRCGEEVITGERAQELHDLAMRLGMHGLESEQTRKLLRTGNSIAVSLDPKWVKEVLHAKPGDTVRIARQGLRLIIRP